MVLSEESLKIKYRKEPFTQIEIKKGTLLTPSAKQFLADKNIEVLENGERKKEFVVDDKEAISSEGINNNILHEKPKFIGEKGEYYFEKPDYLTQVDGILVPKNSQRIIFRAKLELFLSEVLLSEKEVEINFSSEKLKKDISSVVKFTHNIITSEALDKILENQVLLDGKSLKDVQEIYHNPKDYLNKGHLLEITLKNNILVHKINRLRALARELEIAGVDFLVRDNKVNRKDLLEALNVLSSILCIMILKFESGIYGSF